MLPPQFKLKKKGLFVVLSSLILIYSSCKKHQAIHCEQLSYRKDEKHLLKKIFYWLENDKHICLYNSLTKSNIAKYDIYTFYILVNSFTFKRVVYNLKHYNSDIRCEEQRNGDILCNIYFSKAKIPLLFVKGESEYIDEKTGRIKKLKRFFIDLDVEYYLTLLREIKKRYNIDLFYDYYRRRGNN
ncbi:MAG: hypothetical protein ACK4NF_04885 [Planctomycetota bacterium]